MKDVLDEVRSSSARAICNLMNDCVTVFSFPLLEISLILITCGILQIHSDRMFDKLLCFTQARGYMEFGSLDTLWRMLEWLAL